MPDKKNQHFIPRFYLKNFSINFDQKTLGVFNLANSKFISNGRLKTQASKDYFYGQDLSIEDALSELEGSAAIILRNIINKNSICSVSLEDYSTLLEFVLFLSERTAYQADQVNEFFDKTIKAVLSKDSRLQTHLNEGKFLLNQPTQLTLHRAAISLPFIVDLSCKLFINKTTVPFIASDHPVVLYNQFLEKKIEHGGITGLACKGLEIFLPISPNHLLLFFDRDVYKIGNKGDLSVNITTDSDVQALNILQCINANHNLYFNKEISESQVRKLVDQAARYRRRSRANVDEYPAGRKNGKRYILLHTYTADVKCSLTLSCIHTLKKAKQYKFNSDVTPVRDEEFCRLHNHFRKLVKKGQYKPNEFYKGMSSSLCQGSQFS